MSNKLIDQFHWSDIEKQKGEKLTDVEKYEKIACWAAKARGQNPKVFDALTEWVLDDTQWIEEKLAIGPWHGFWGRFMKADTPVPEGFLYFDFLPFNDGKAGPPFISQFAYATFSGDMDAMHKCEGYDCDAMYDVTRNIMLGQGVPIPYPDKYWTAEVFLNGCDKYSTAYMFSAEL